MRLWKGFKTLKSYNNNIQFLDWIASLVNSFCYSCFVSALMSVGFTSFSASILLIQHLVSLILGGSVAYPRIPRNRIADQAEISGIVGS